MGVSSSPADNWVIWFVVSPKTCSGYSGRGTGQIMNRRKLWRDARFWEPCLNSVTYIANYRASASVDSAMLSLPYDWTSPIVRQRSGDRQMLCLVVYWRGGR